MNQKKKILIDLKRYLQRNYSGIIKDIILFGSQVKETRGNDSDYDILIVLADDYTWKDENHILDLCYDIDLKYNILIDAHIISTNELTSLRGKQPLYINALKTGLFA